MDELWSAAKVCRVANVMRRTRSRSKLGQFGSKKAFPPPELDIR